MLRSIAILVGLLALTSCYDSPSDLLGDNANAVEKFESLIVVNGLTYQVVPHGKTSTLCSLLTKSDLTKPCVSEGELKLERTVWGNYIIQARVTKTGKYNYALWLRSDPDKLSEGRPCLLWLGEGVVGMSAQTSAVAVRNAGSPEWTQFTNKLKSIASEPAINRAQLKAIAKVYEDGIVDLTADKWKCFGDRASLNNSLIAIEGDNRHLQPFVRPNQ